MMKKLLFVMLILLQSNQAFSQFNDEDIAFELRYPIPVGNNFINKGADKGYRGIVDIGIDYTVFKVNKLDVGLLINTSFLRFKPSDLNLTTINPKVKFGYNFIFDRINIVPQVAVGYSNYIFNGDEYKENKSGISFRGATKLIWKNGEKINWYFLLAYEFTKLEKFGPGVPHIAFNRNIQIMYPGIGVVWKFKNS